MKETDRRFYFAIFYFIVGLFCFGWGSGIYYRYPQMLHIMKLAFKASFTQFIAGFVCFGFAYMWLNLYKKTNK
jgi:hypothetical protein